MSRDIHTTYTPNIPLRAIMHSIKHRDALSSEQTGDKTPTSLCFTEFGRDILLRFEN